MDPLDIIAQWRRDIALADGGDGEAGMPLRGEWSASAGGDAPGGSTLAPGSDESSGRHATTDNNDDRT